MRFAEVFLRMGSSLVAWMMLYAYVVWLAALHAIGCGPDGDELHRLLLGLALLAVGFSFVLRVTDPFAEIQNILRWLGAPLLLLLPFALRSIWSIFNTVNLGSSAICANEPPAGWQLLWAPLQVLALLIVAYGLIRVWRSVAPTVAK